MPAENNSDIKLCQNMSIDNMPQTYLTDNNPVSNWRKSVLEKAKIDH